MANPAPLSYQDTLNKMANLDELSKFHLDFKECFYFFTIRHHVAAYYSTINNLSLRYKKKYKNLRHSFTTFYRCEIDSDLGQKLNLKYICIKLEDLPHKKTLISLCKLMRVNFSKILTSTFENLKWNGDSISRKIYNDVWTKNRTYNQWREKLSKNEKFLTNILFYKKLKHYKYSYFKVNLLDYLKYFEHSDDICLLNSLYLYPNVPEFVC